MESLFIKTPLIYSKPLSDRTRRRIYLKMECFQPSGSFKNRGIGALIEHYAKEGKKGVVATSGGNAGLAAAYAARQLTIPAKVIVPQKTPPFMIDKMRNEGAEVISHGADWAEANELSKEIAKANDFGYVSPFDHPEIWRGHATLVREIGETPVKPDAIVLSVGGGGLMNGVIHGLWDLGWRQTAVITSETDGASALAQSMAAGKRVFLDRPNSVATSLCAPYVSEETFDLTDHHRVLPQVVEDKESTRACVRFAEDHRVLVEPACGAALALLYKNLSVFTEFSNIVVVVCGGNLVNCDMLRHW